MIGADAIIKCLEEEGVSTVFGYPGVAICPFFNSILDSDIKTVLIRTEQNAAHAASGVARMTGRPGVCAVTSGPGATNVITGIATAFADSIPLICITGQVNSELLGSDVFQEADITGAVESFVKYSYLVKNVNDIPRVFREAFYIANTGRKGPVLIDIPIDIQNATIKNFHYPEEVNLRTYKPTVKGHAVQIKKVIRELEKAKRPIICAGGGVGVAPMLPIIKALKNAGNKVISILAGRSKELIILEDEVRKHSDEVIIMTDDGSYGKKGVVTVGIEEVILREKVDKCFAIGPAIMMKFCCL